MHHNLLQQLPPSSPLPTNQPAHSTVDIVIYVWYCCVHPQNNSSNYAESGTYNNGVRLNDGQSNLNQGAWKKFENEMRNNVKAGESVEIRVEAIYDAANLSARPDSFVGNYRINGGRWIFENYTNKF